MVPYDWSEDLQPDIRGLVEVERDILVTQRGVELPADHDWEFEDILTTLAEIEYL
jgi:hypothetical protein